jgi:lipid-binding SYLF domain-containing protein
VAISALLLSGGAPSVSDSLDTEELVRFRPCGGLLARVADRVIRIQPQGGNVRKAALAFLILLTSVPLAMANMNHDEKGRVEAAASVLRELNSIPDYDIPATLWTHADCVGVIPSVKKGAFLFGGEYGKGVVSCRTHDGWSAPAFFTLEKGSWGFQFGGAETDLVFLIMNQDGLDHLLQDKFTLGASGQVAAGPVGRRASASTDISMHTEIVSYSRSRGLFAGIDISGGVITPDSDANADAYGRNVTPRDILVKNSFKIPQPADGLMAALRTESDTAQRAAGGEY